MACEAAIQQGHFWGHAQPETLCCNPPDAMLQLKVLSAYNVHALCWDSAAELQSDEQHSMICISSWADQLP